MLTAMRTVWPLFVAVAFMMVGNGLQGTLLGLRAGYVGFDATVTGLVMSAYYGGYMLSSFATPRFIASVGHVRVFAAFASIASSAVLLHALFADAMVWAVMRFISGFSLAGLYMVAESWLNGAASDATRGRVLSLYMIILYGGMASGQYLLALSDPAEFAAFVMVSILVSLALVPIALAPSPVPETAEAGPVGLMELYRHSPLGFLTCLFVGAANGALLSMGAVYGSLLGLSTVQVALLMGLPLAGVIATQYPIGLISDRVDRRWVIFAVALFVGLCGGALALAAERSLLVLFILFTAYGAVSAPLYSLAIAHTNDNLERGKMVGASAKLVLVSGAGAVLGPALAGAAMSLAGAAGFFIIGAAIHLTLAGFALYRMTHGAPIALEERGEFVHVALRATPVAAAAAVEEAAAAEGADGG